MIYTTKDGDRVDLICSQHYPNQNLSSVVAAVFDKNKGLCQHPDVLPRGLDIELPELETVEPLKEQVNLWD